MGESDCNSTWASDDDIEVVLVPILSTIGHYLSPKLQEQYTKEESNL